MWLLGSILGPVAWALQSTCADHPNHGLQSYDLATPSLSTRLVLGPRLVRLGCPVQAPEVEVVDSTSNTSTLKHWWILDVFRPRLLNAASIPQYTSDAPVGMLRRGILIHPSCLEGERPGAAVQTPRSAPSSGGDWKPMGTERG